MDIDTAFLISLVMCLPCLTFIAYFFDNNKPSEGGWKGFFKWFMKSLRKNSDGDTDSFDNKQD